MGCGNWGLHAGSYGVTRCSVSLSLLSPCVYINAYVFMHFFSQMFAGDFGLTVFTPGLSELLPHATRYPHYSCWHRLSLNIWSVFCIYCLSLLVRCITLWPLPVYDDPWLRPVRWKSSRKLSNCQLTYIVRSNQQNVFARPLYLQTSRVPKRCSNIISSSYSNSWHGVITLVILPDVGVGPIKCENSR